MHTVATTGSPSLQPGALAPAKVAVAGATGYTGQELLRLLVADFDVVVSRVDEADYAITGSPEEYARKLATAKAAEVGTREEGLILAAQRCVSLTELAKRITPRHQLLDINGWPELRGLGVPYEGFCW